MFVATDWKASTVANVTLTQDGRWWPSARVFEQKKVKEGIAGLGLRTGFFAVLGRL